MVNVTAMYITGDEITLPNCRSINDIKVQIANLHNKFATDTIITNSSFDEIEEVNENVRVILTDEVYDNSLWKSALIAHATALDTNGLKRIDKIMGKKFVSEVFVDYLNESLEPTVEEIQCFLDAAVDIDHEDGFGMTALCYAAQYGHFDIVQCLLLQGANPHLADSIKGMEPLSYASQNDHAEIVRLLLSAGANLNHKDKFGQSALVGACKNGCLAAAEVLISASSTCGSDIYRNTALSYASDNGHTEIVKLLLDSGAHLDFIHWLGRTALLIACSSGHLEIAKLLVSRGANLSHEDDFGMTALHHAAMHGCVDLVQFLLSVGACPAKEDSKGRTARESATENDSVDVAEVLSVCTKRRVKDVQSTSSTRRKLLRCALPGILAGKSR